MNTDINLTNETIDSVRLTRFEDEVTPWSSLRIETDDGNVCLLCDDTLLREIVRVVEIELREDELVCDHDNCDEPQSMKVTYETLAVDDFVRFNYCNDHAAQAFREFRVTDKIRSLTACAL